MATYLELCQSAARESGTISGTQPASVLSQTGKLAKIVKWVDLAWTTIQTAHGNWRWMEGEFEGPTIANQQRYDGSDFGVTTRFGDWLCRQDEDEDRFTIYDPDIGLSDESQLSCLPWDIFYTTRLRGVQSTGKPSQFAISPAGQMVFVSVPDKVYRVKGPYVKDVQSLTADSDVPEMPARFHNLIVEIALSYLSIHDESPQYPLWQLQQFRRFTDLEREQLPKTRLGGPFA